MCVLLEPDTMNEIWEWGVCFVCMCMGVYLSNWGVLCLLAWVGVKLGRVVSFFCVCPNPS